MEGTRPIYSVAAVAAPQPARRNLGAPRRRQWNVVPARSGVPLLLRREAAMSRPIERLRTVALFAVVIQLWVTITSPAAEVSGGEAAPPASSSQPVLNVPDGFSIELVAGPPLVERPITGAFDDEGQLYVAES